MILFSVVKGWSTIGFSCIGQCESHGFLSGFDAIPENAENAIQWVQIGPSALEAGGQGSMLATGPTLSGLHPFQTTGIGGRLFGYLAKGHLNTQANSWSGKTKFGHLQSPVTVLGPRKVKMARSSRLLGANPNPHQRPN